MLDLPAFDVGAASEAQVLLKMPLADHLILTGGLSRSIFGPERQTAEPERGLVVPDLEADPNTRIGLPFGIGAIVLAAMEAPEPPSLAMPGIGIGLIWAGIRGKRSLRRERHANTLRRRIKTEHRKMALQV